MPYERGGSFRLGDVVALGLMALAPLGHLLVLPTGVRASGTDLLVGASVLAFVVSRRSAGSTDGTLPALLLAGFAAWCLVGSLWSLTPEYAWTKGFAYAALIACAYGVAQSDTVRSGQAHDAWVCGIALSLITLGVGWALGGAARERVLFDGGGVSGLGFPRARGPFAHPNEFGGFLAVSVPLLWARTPVIRKRLGLAATSALWGGVTLAGVLTASSAWFAVGALLLLTGVCLTRWTRSARLVASSAGAAIVFVVLSAALGRGMVGPLTFNGIRPAIWRSSLDAVRAAPFRGVGGTPVVASAIDPAAPEWGPLGWDAHQMVLSLWAQFGLPGLLLFFGAWSMAAWRVVRNMKDPGTDGDVSNTARDRLQIATLGAVAVWLSHGVLIANEDLRHGWLLLGLLIGMGMRRNTVGVTR